MTSTNLHEKYSNYRYCIDRECKNTSIKTPGKLWIRVPSEINIRSTWLRLAQRDPESLSTVTQMYFCEDHFDLQNDMENYMQYKIMGTVKRIRTKPGCIPSKFECQSGKKLPNDMDNYMQYHVMGSVSQVRMKPGCLPTKFECQPGRRKRTSNAKKRSYALKKNRKLLIEECEKDLREKSVEKTSLGSSESAVVSDSSTSSAISAKVHVKIENVEEDPENMSMYPDDGPESSQDIDLKLEELYENRRCNECNGEITGLRYVCVQCSSLELCGGCEARGAHAHHYVLRPPAHRAHLEVEAVLAAIRHHALKDLDPIREYERDPAGSVKSENMDNMLENEQIEDDELHDMETTASPEPESTRHFIEGENEACTDWAITSDSALPVKEEPDITNISYGEPEDVQQQHRIIELNKAGYSENNVAKTLTISHSTERSCLIRCEEDGGIRTKPNHQLTTTSSTSLDVNIPIRTLQPVDHVKLRNIPHTDRTNTVRFVRCVNTNSGEVVGVVLPPRMKLVSVLQQEPLPTTVRPGDSLVLQPHHPIVVPIPNDNDL